MKPGDVELLKQIAQFEATINWGEFTTGWSWRDVRVWPATLNRLFKEGYLENVFHSNSYTGYRLSELGRAMAAAGSEEVSRTPQEAQIEVPPDIFGEVIGHDEVKELIKAALSAGKPVHVLLAGPPALAKSLFLWDLEQMAGERALWLLGSATSKAGLWDMIAERQPRWLLIDELDKMSAVDTAGLLSIMEGGRLVRAKKGREMDRTVPLWVVAATNHLEKLSPELRSRFAIRRLCPYTREEFREVVKGVLVRREEAAPEVAAEIAARLDGRTQDVRDAVRVSRLAPQVGVEKAVRLLLGG